MTEIAMLAELIVDYLAGNLADDDGSFAKVKRASDIVMDYFSSSQRIEIAKNPQNFVQTIAQTLERLPVYDPIAWRRIEGSELKIEARRRPSQRVSVNGLHNQVFNAGGNVVIRGDGSPLGGSVFASVFGEETPGESELKVLFLCANPSGKPLKLDREICQIQSSLEHRSAKQSVTLKHRWAVTPKGLRQAILDEAPKIVHFSGHGSRLGIWLQGETGDTKIVDSDALASLFALFCDSIECVIFSSCYSAEQAQAVSRHIPYVIGMSTRLLDSTATAFCAGFYQGIGAGKTIPTSFELGKAAIKMEGVEADMVPVLLGRNKEV